MRTKTNQLTSKSSMFMLAAFVLAGAVVTTLVQADDQVWAADAPSYLQPALYREAAPQPSRHRWLLPASVQTRFESGAYNVYLQEADSASADTGHEPPNARMSFSLGDLRRARAGDRHSRALMSDWERDQYRRNGAWFSMSVGKRW